MTDWTVWYSSVLLLMFFLFLSSFLESSLITGWELNNIIVFKLNPALKIKAKTLLVWALMFNFSNNGFLTSSKTAASTAAITSAIISLSTLYKLFNAFSTILLNLTALLLENSFLFIAKGINEAYECPEICKAHIPFKILLVWFSLFNDLCLLGVKKTCGFVSFSPKWKFLNFVISSNPEGFTNDGKFSILVNNLR